MKRNLYLCTGFTLIELSVVLVIIGLIAGGVLVGRELIQAAAARAFVTQIEKYMQAYNTFQSKYNALPGDMTVADATMYGFTTGTGVAGNGDGNGLIDICGGTGSPLGFGCEMFLVWVQLSQAKMIDESYSLNGGTTASNSFFSSPDTISKFLPRAKAGTGYIYIGPGTSSAYSRKNVFFTTGLTLSSTPSVVTSAALNAPQAYAMDSKIDDGMPLLGMSQSIRFIYDSASSGSITVGNQINPPGYCYTWTGSTATTVFNLGTSTSAQPGCQFIILVR